MSPQFFLFAIIAATCLYAYLNGANDSGGLVAAAISSRSLSPRSAFLIAAISEFAGPFLFGTAVATTIGSNLVQSSAITPEALLIAILCAIAWGIVTGKLGLPSSSTHALVGGLIGAVAIQSGAQALLVGGFVKVALALFAAPILGMFAGYLTMKVLALLTRHSTPHVNQIFKRAQAINVAALALSHGTNDGQKSMALIALGLLATQTQSAFAIPLWVTCAVALSLTLGILTGGWQIIRTMGEKIYRVRPIHASAAQTGSAAVVFIAALLGAPVSTTQVTSSAIVGAGSAERMSGVRWHVAGQIAGAWFITIPASALLAGLVEKSLTL